MLTPRFILAVLLIGALGGLALTQAVVTANWRPGMIRAGAWAIWPKEGARDADPYTRAAIARSGDLPLGLGEGLTFTAREDSAGRALDGRCRYRILGAMPPARAWTLALFDEDGRLHPNPAQRYGFTSAEVLRGTNGGIDIALDAEAAPGDWLPMPARGGVRLVLRVYDTPLATVTSAVGAANLPRIEREACR